MHVGDTIFIFCLALIIFGPKKLPEIGRQIGKLMVEFRRASNEFKMQIDEELRASEESERQKEITAARASAAPPAPDQIMLAAGSDGTPVIAPPSTGVPVNHTFASPEPASSWETPAPTAASTWETPASLDPFPESTNGFNAGLNTASNGLISESAGDTAATVAALEVANAPLSEAEKAQATLHHD
jgi:sec-independent protein translocase protein TatB